MAEAVKKDKTPAKSSAAKSAKKTPAAKKESTSKKEPAASKREPVAKPSHHEIAQLAQKYWAERGHHDGHAEQDWLRAEQELGKKGT